MEKYYIKDQREVSAMADMLRKQGKVVELTQINETLWVLTARNKKVAYLVA